MVSCPVCQGAVGPVVHADVRDFEYDSPGAYSYSFCTGCGALVIDPVPDGALLALAYPENYHAYQAHLSALASTLKQRYWRGLARDMVRRVGTSARILDVGCASGDLLAALRDLGVTSLLGVEYSTHAGGVARSKGFEVIEGELGDVTEAHGPFDLIAMINMIEHVSDPTATMRHARSLLVPGGLILGETPNHDAWDRTLFGRYWGGYHTPRHLVIFHEPSLRVLGEKSGLKLTEFRNIIQPAHWALSVQNALACKGLGPGPSSGRSPLFPWLLLAFAPVNMVQFLLSATSSISFCYQKTAPSR